MGKDVIVACDFSSRDETMAFLDNFKGRKPFVKIGMELFYAEGPDIVREIKARGHKIFLDLKLHDIPNTVASGLCSLMELEPTMLNVHASGGYTMMKTAADRLHEEAERRGISCPKLIAVTVLTSIDKDDWNHMGQSLPIKSTVVRWAMLARKAGLDGVVASPQEAAFIREACGEDFLIVTPGVRPAGAAVNDQSRIATPADALQRGATHLVIGRPIRAAADPREAALAILKEMETVK